MILISMHKNAYGLKSSKIYSDYVLLLLYFIDAFNNRLINIPIYFMGLNL